MARVIKGKHPVVRRMTFRGLRIAIETDRGDVRHWRGGETKMYFPYGYFEGTKASGVSGDGMALDVYVGPEHDAENVYVVRQMKKPDFDTFDEYKVMLGFESEKRARAVYLMHYNDERFLGSIESYSFQEFVDKFIDLDDADNAEVAKALGYAPQLPNAVMPGQPVGVAAPPMMMPMMRQGPPPIDVDTYEGVDAALGRVGTMKDQELLRVVEKIWGPGYQYINATPDHVRAEVRNFLLDQRDMLASLQSIALSPPTPSSSPFSPASSLTGTSVPPSPVGIAPSSSSASSAGS